MRRGGLKCKTEVGTSYKRRQRCREKKGQGQASGWMVVTAQMSVLRPGSWLRVCHKASGLPHATTQEMPVRKQYQGVTEACLTSRSTWGILISDLDPDLGPDAQTS